MYWGGCGLGGRGVLLWGKRSRINIFAAPNHGAKPFLYFFWKIVWEEAGGPQSTGRAQEALQYGALPGTARMKNSASVVTFYFFPCSIKNTRRKGACKILFGVFSSNLFKNLYSRHWWLCDSSLLRTPMIDHPPWVFVCWPSWYLVSFFYVHQNFEIQNHE